MDKKNLTIGAALLVAAFALFIFGPRAPTAPPKVEKPAPTATSTTSTAGTTAPASAPGQSATPSATASSSAFAAASHESIDATITTLSNGVIEARFTDAGGALRDVALIQRDEKHNRLVYPETLGGNAPYVFNALHADPILAFVEYPGLDRNARYERVSQSATEVVYRAVLDHRLEVTRRYVLSPAKGENSDPYRIRHETTLRNLSEQTAPPMRVALSLGTADAIHSDERALLLKGGADKHVWKIVSDDPRQQLAAGFSTGSDRQFIPRAKLEAGNGFLGLGAHGAAPLLTHSGPIMWGAVKNQFFTSILTGDEPASALTTRRVKLLTLLPDDAANAYGITGAAQFDVKALGAKADAKLSSSLYVGPKEYDRLANTRVFKADEDKVMDFGFFKFFSQILLWLMTKIHGWTQNWGLAIILTTLSLKTVFIPFTLAASRSAKRMAKIQPEIQALREKYKDNPQKQQQATMELFKTRKINPVGGCFPVLITMPFFFGFFQMLQSTAELRYQPFLRAPDLSSTDTVAVLFGLLPLNIMPLLMGATMVVQMQLTPSPSVDNAQVKMMKFMPYMFMLFCYNFSCALSLYSFVNGLFTIGQQLVINRMKDAVEPMATASPSGKPIKNVTPSGKKLK